MTLKRKPEDGRKRMRGGVHTQVEGLYHFVRGIGMSRHRLKTAKITDIWIHSDNTRATYLRVWHRVADHAYQDYGIMQILDIPQEVMMDWLEHQLLRNLAPTTISTYLAAISKFRQAQAHYWSEGGKKNG